MRTYGERPRRPDTTRLAAHVLIAWQGVRRRPLRNVLTAVSLLVGVLSVVLIQGAGARLNDAIVRDAVLGNGQKSTLLVPVTERGRGDLGDLRDNVTDWRDTLARVTADGAGVAATFIQDGDARVHDGEGRDGSSSADGGEIVPGLDLLAVDPALREIRPFPVVHGQWFQLPTHGPQLVINKAAWRQGAWEDADVWLSRDGSYDRHRARLVGVVDDGGGEPQGYVSLDGGGLWSKAAYREDTAVSVLLHSATLDANTLRARVDNYAQRSGRHAELGDVRRLDSIDDHAAPLDASRRIFLAVASLSLFVGCLGILNVGLATLRERSEELSLRRSFGATRGHVIQIMIMESQIVALGAATVAIALAYFATPFLLQQVGTQSELISTGLPVSAMLAGLLTSCGVALLGALAPALRASRVPIATIMR